MKRLERLKIGLPIIYIAWFTFIFIRLIQLPIAFFNHFWIWFLLLSVVTIALAYNIGEVIERTEAVYLKGQYLASGKFTITNKELEK